MFGGQTNYVCAGSRPLSEINSARVASNVNLYAKSLKTPINTSLYPLGHIHSDPVDLLLLLEGCCVTCGRVETTVEHERAKQVLCVGYVRAGVAVEMEDE